MPSLNWSHAIIAIVLLIAGAYLGVKQPSLVSKLTFGTIA